MVAAREVETHGAQHRRARLLDVHATGGDPAADHLGQQRVDAVPPLGVLDQVPWLGPAGRAGATREPRDQESGRLEVGERLRGARVTGQVGRRRGADGLLGRDAEQQVTLPRGERGEDLVRDPVDQRNPVGAQAFGRGPWVGGGGEGAGGQHDGGAPPLGAMCHESGDLGVGGPSVSGDQLGRLGVVEAQQATAEHGEVAEQLGAEPCDRQVPAREQQQPHRLGPLAEHAVEEPEAHRREAVRVVDDDQGPGTYVALVTGRLLPGLGQRRPQVVGGPRGIAVQPPGARAEVVVVEPAPHPEGLARADRTHEQGDGGAGGRVESLPQRLARHVDLRQAREPVDVPAGTGRLRVSRGWSCSRRGHAPPESGPPGPSQAPCCHAERSATRGGPPRAAPGQTSCTSVAIAHITTTFSVMTVTAHHG